jgi:prevent-host-death family protein
MPGKRTTRVNVHEAKTHLSRLSDRAANGEEIVIARSGRPVARLVALASKPGRRKPGLLKGRLEVSHDFDAPLPAEMLDAFDHGPIEPPTGRGRA